MTDNRKAYCVDDNLSELHLLLVDTAERAYMGQTIPQGWSCALLYSGRNRLYEIKTSRGDTYVVKRFGRLSLLRRLYYSYLGSSKAKRSCLNALSLGFLNISTPQPIGYLEQYGAFGLIGQTYYTSRSAGVTEGSIHPHMRGWTAPEGFLPALADFVANLHQAGVAHHDLSPGNILYRLDSKGQYHFSLVDVNRMSFSAYALSSSQSVRNLSRLASNLSVSTTLAQYYAKSRGWEIAPTVKQINERCDAFWLGRLPKLSVRYAKRVYGISPICFVFRLLLPYWLLSIKSKFATGSTLEIIKKSRQAFYSKYLSAEDIRHVYRKRHGFDYHISTKYPPTTL